MYLDMNELGKNEDGFVRRSEAKLKGGKALGIGENSSENDLIWVRSRFTTAGFPLSGGWRSGKELFAGDHLVGGGKFFAMGEEEDAADDAPEERGEVPEE